MGPLILRRLLMFVPTFLLVSVGVFALSFGLNPERAAIARAGGQDATPADIAAARAELELDEPVVVRYVNWLGRIVRGDLGRSSVQLVPTQIAGQRTLEGRPVWATISERLPRSLSLMLVSVAFVVLIGVPVGIVGGVRPGSLADRLTMVVTVSGLAIPSFLIGMLLVSWFAIRLDWLPAAGYTTIQEGGYWGWFEHLLLPGFALALGPAALVARQLRSSLIEVMGSPYVRTAWAKGVSLPRVVAHHALKNALSAPLTVFGLSLVSILGSAVIVETLFGISGLSSVVVSAVRSNDIPMLQGVVLLFLVLNMAVNLAIDITYGFLSPKVRVT